MFYRTIINKELQYRRNRNEGVWEVAVVQTNAGVSNVTVLEKIPFEDEGNLESVLLKWAVVHQTCVMFNVAVFG